MFMLYIDYGQQMKQLITLRLIKRDATLKPWAVINMIIPVGIIMLMTGGFL
jgi:hypothetical protein